MGEFKKTIARLARLEALAHRVKVLEKWVENKK
jgi:hypothetical protein